MTSGLFFSKGLAFGAAGEVARSSKIKHTTLGHYAYEIGLEIGIEKKGGISHKQGTEHKQHTL
jgi:hypothetical protein